MRLIDADVLKKYIDDCKCCEKCSEKMRNCNDGCEFPDFLTRQWERAIDEQPTVEINEDMIIEYCRKRCLVIMTAEAFADWFMNRRIDL